MPPGLALVSRALATCMELNVTVGPAMTPLPHPVARSWLVGRSPEGDLVAASDGVSARHCRLTATAGGLVVEDLGSTNGTFVNGRRIAGPTPVRPGDRVTLGRAAAMPWPPGCGPAALRVGRAPDNDVVAAHPAVSARHAVLLPHGATFAVEDRGSANGTFVNGTRVAGRAAVRPGDRLAFGPAEYVLTAAGALAPCDDPRSATLEARAV